MELKKKDIDFLKVVWKDGRFVSYKFVGIRDTLERLLKLGIIQKSGEVGKDFFNYSVKREKFIEIMNQQPKPTKQEKLFFGSEVGEVEHSLN